MTEITEEAAPSQFTMWHEARKQEKKIRGLMVDYKRRAERRREFYEKIKLDPAQFVRVFGQACKINLDPAIAVAAESPQSMMPWQGDTSNMIDRFDVRAHLDIMPPEKSYTVELTKEQEDEERKANYERYRIIVENECAGLTEEQALQQLYFDELYGAINKDGEEEKNKLKDKKAAIGYVYEDSTKEQEEEEEDSEDSDEDIETLDLDMALDVDSLTTDQMEQLNICGTQFGMGKEDFIKYLQRDKDESEALKQAKLLEEEKAQFAGRKSRRERRIYKERRLAGRKLSPPSYAARDSPKYEPYRRSPSRSRSRSRSPPKKSRKMYITSFGENDDSDDGIGVVQGPELPPGLGTHKETEKKTEATCEPNDKSSRNRSRGSHSSERSPRKKDKFEKSKRSRSRSRDYRSRRSRSRGRRSRSYDRRSRNGQDHRSRSREFNRRSHDRYSSERSRRRRSSDRYRSQRSRSRSRHSRSYERHSGTSRHNRSVSRSRSKSRSRSRRSSVSSSSSSSRSRSSSRSSRSKSRSPVKPVIKSYRRESLSSKSDSESDSDDVYKPQTSRSNLPSSSRAGLSKPSGMFGKSASNTQKLTPQEKLKRRMQMALSKQYKADKKAEILKQEKMEQEKMDREEELRQRALEMRRKEREKRHREMEDTFSDDESSRGSSPSRYPRENRSPHRKTYHEEDRRKKHRSRSRSRSQERRRPPHYRSDY